MWSICSSMSNLVLFHLYNNYDWESCQEEQSLLDFVPDCPFVSGLASPTSFQSGREIQCSTVIQTMGYGVRWHRFIFYSPELVTEQASECCITSLSLSTPICKTGKFVWVSTSLTECLLGLHNMMCVNCPAHRNNSKRGSCGCHTGELWPNCFSFNFTLYGPRFPMCSVNVKEVLISY